MSSFDHIKPEEMVADLDKKISWFDQHPPINRMTGAPEITQPFVDQVNMLRAMREYIHNTSKG